MRRLLRPSIARRLMGALLVACALVWGAIYAFGRQGVYEPISGSFDRELLSLADAARLLVQAHAADGELHAALSALAAKITADEGRGISPPGFLALRVSDAYGHVLAEAGTLPRRWRPAAPPQGGPWDAHGSDGLDYRLHLAEVQGHVILAAQSMDSREQAFDRVMLSRDGFLKPLLIAFPLVLLPVWLAVFTGLRPLRRLSRELAARKPSDLGAIGVPEVHELAPVARELNGTLARLHQLLQRERNFLADAAHELRTPLAVISAQCDSLMLEQSAASREAAGERLRSGLQRASRLVNQLLELARLDADIAHPPVTANLADLVRDGLAAHASAAMARGIEIGYCGPDNLFAANPGHAFESVVDNLVGNAVRHGGAGGRVEVRLAVEGDERLVLQVSDDGPGIAPQDRSHVFERFRRGSQTAASGSGLGLAIVASAARRLGASLELADGLAGRGLRVRLTWPAAASP